VRARPFTSPFRTLLLAAVVAVALLAGSACGGAPPRPTVAIDRLVDLGGGAGRLHLRCEGRGATTVLLLAGWGDGGDRWGPLEGGLAERARVCVPARFGTGTSDPPAGTQTFATQAADLRRLLEEAGEPGPYVVVGHSFGGAVAMAFASAHSRDVVGLALLDTSPPTWPATVCAVPDDGSALAATFRDTCAQMSDPTANPERLDAVRAFREVAAMPSLGRLPLVVLTRAAPAYPGLADDAASDLATAWRRGQEEWAARSQLGRVVPLDTEEHDVHLAAPDRVLDEVRGLVP
jgi:pimeloyl-ACP methyl ester carboxylesterase